MFVNQISVHDTKNLEIIVFEFTKSYLQNAVAVQISVQKLIKIEEKLLQYMKKSGK